MDIKEQLEHALAFGYPVRITLNSSREMEGVVWHARLKCFSMESVGGMYYGYCEVNSVARESQPEGGVSDGNESR